MKDAPSNHETPDSVLEARLSRVLGRLPDAPLASNFTACVMQAVELEDLRRSRKWSFSWNWHYLLPRAAVVAAIVLFAGLSFQYYETGARRAQVARSVALVAGTPMPNVEALQNFDTIRRMSQPARPDNELLALMQ